MARAGFYAISASRIVFGRDGHWYADGELITNPRIALLFSRHLVRSDNGSYQIVMGDERATVEVEDTPWVVTTIEGTPERGFVITLNDGSQEPLRPGSIMIEDDDAFSCEVKNGSARARFLRPAHYAFARHAEAADATGSFSIVIEGRRYDLARRGSSHS